MSTTAASTTWSPSLQDLNNLWADVLAVGAALVHHGVHFFPFEIVQSNLTGYGLPQLRTKTRRGADTIFLTVARTGQWVVNDGWGDEEGEFFPFTTNSRVLAEAVIRAHNTATA